jgi:hypothetical protein
VTRETYGSERNYYKELAKEIFKILDQPIQVFLKHTKKIVVAERLISFRV